MRAVIPEILSLLANATSLFKPTAEMAKVWEALLDRFTDDTLRGAAVAVAQKTHYGAPTVGDLVEHIEGRVEYDEDRSRFRVFPDGHRERLAEDLANQLERMRDDCHAKVPEFIERYVAYHGEDQREVVEKAPLEKLYIAIDPDYTSIVKKIESLRFNPYLALRSHELPPLRLEEKTS